MPRNVEAFECRACGAPIQAENLDRRLAIASCHHCGAIFDLTRRRTPDAEQIKSAAPSRAPAALPSKFRLSDRGDGTLRISWIWFSSSAVLQVFFALAWDAGLLLWYGTMATRVGAPVAAWVLPIAHAAVGVWITYSALASVLNRTTVSVTQTKLRVRHWPIPWWPCPTILASSLEQLYVERKLLHGKNRTIVTWKLMAVTRDHRGQEIVSGLDELGQALFLEQEIERILDIRDRRVAGEYGSRGESM